MLFGFQKSDKYKYLETQVNRNSFRDKMPNLENPYKIVFESSHEIDLSFATLFLKDNITSRTVIKNENGDEVCLATFTSIHSEFKTEKEATDAVLELNSKESNCYYSIFHELY